MEKLAVHPRLPTWFQRSIVAIRGRKGERKRGEEEKRTGGEEKGEGKGIAPWLGRIAPFGC